MPLNTIKFACDCERWMSEWPAAAVNLLEIFWKSSWTVQAERNMSLIIFVLSIDPANQRVQWQSLETTRNSLEINLNNCTTNFGLTTLSGLYRLRPIKCLNLQSTAELVGWTVYRTPIWALIQVWLVGQASVDDNWLKQFELIQVNWK